MEANLAQPHSNMKAEPRDVFLHLLAMVSLYTSAISFITLVFQIINYFIPDQLVSFDSYYRDGILGTMRWAIAALIVMFPAYLITMRFLAKSYEADATKRSLGVRKWLVYFTLLVAALIFLGDLVSLIYAFLQGDTMTARFLLKVLTIFFVTGSVFYYYFTDIRKKDNE